MRSSEPARRSGSSGSRCAWSFGLLLLMMLPAGGAAIGAALVDAPMGKAALIILAMIAAGFAMIVWGLWCFLKFAPMAQVLAMEDLGGWRRSAHERAHVGAHRAGVLRAW